LHPAPGSPRNSPIAGVLLTNADLDHALGLFTLREGDRMNIYAPKAVREVLAKRLGVEAVLEAFCGADWHEPPAEFAPIAGASSAISYRAIALPGEAPLYAGETGSAGVHSVAYQFLDQQTGGRLLVAPDVGAVTAELRAALRTSDAIVFDGTFWSRDELTAMKPDARTPEAMGHVTIKDCSLDLLAKLPAGRKIYAHINNTNPVLSPDTAERAAVEGAGITVGHDGLEFEL
jgi:pyrroloquinoline quinone biosynthesis protein B